MIKPLCLIIGPSGKSTLIGDGPAWESIMCGSTFCAIVWFKRPTEEQRNTALSRMKVFTETKEMEAIPYHHEAIQSTSEPVPSQQPTKGRKAHR